MTQRNNISVQPIDPTSLRKRMLLGARIGLLLISLFLFSAGEPKPEWGKLWMIRPLIIVPLAGAMGGLCNYFIDQVGINKIIAVFVSIIVFIVGLWLGVVLGLDGTWWD